MTRGIIYSVLYINHEQTGDIITLSQFEEGDLLENRSNAEEDESILYSIVELCADDESYNRYIITNDLEDILDGSRINPEIWGIYARFKISDRIIQMKYVW